MKPKAHVSIKKKEEVVRLTKLVPQYPIIGIADLTGMPSAQLQKLRKSLKDSVLVTMSKRSLIELTFKELKGKVEGIENLKEHIKGMPALLLTKENPFKLAKILRKSKSSAPAKPGQTAPNDITV